MDFSGLTNDDLTSILTAQGIPDAEAMTRQEKEFLVRSIMGDEDSSSEVNPPVLPPPPTTILSNVTNEAVLPPQVVEEQNTVTTSNENPDGNNNVPAEDVLTEDQNLAISQFCEMTGTDPSFAKTVLDATSWNLETAVSLHLEGVGLSRTNSYQPAQPRPPLAPMEVDDDDHRIPGIIGSSIPHPLAGTEDWQRLMTMRRFMDHVSHEDEDDDEDGPHSVEYDEDGVRKPDPVKMQRLISRQYSAERSVFGRADDPSIDWLFPPPRHLSLQESFENAKAKGKEEKKWVLVNIQSHEEFPSHLLNRDTWVNESIEPILRASYVFWQRGHTTPDGQDFMRLYHIPEDRLPHICIIDPRTGANLFNWTGFIEAEELALKLTDFLDSHPLEVPVQNTSSGRNSLQASDVQDDIPKKVDQSMNNQSIPQKETPVLPLPPAIQDFGAVPVVPDDKDPNAVKIAIKLSNGKSLTRKYDKSEKIRSLFAAAIEADPENRNRSFDLISRFPPLNLSTCLGKSIDECQIAGGNLLHRWL